jgi:hypothetical protein
MKLTKMGKNWRRTEKETWLLEDPYKVDMTQERKKKTYHRKSSHVTSNSKALNQGADFYS